MVLGSATKWRKWLVGDLWVELKWGCLDKVITYAEVRLSSSVVVLKSSMLPGAPEKPTASTNWPRMKFLLWSVFGLSRVFRKNIFFSGIHITMHLTLTVPSKTWFLKISSQVPAVELEHIFFIRYCATHSRKIEWFLRVWSKKQSSFCLLLFLGGCSHLETNHHFLGSPGHPKGSHKFQLGLECNSVVEYMPSRPTGAQYNNNKTNREQLTAAAQGPAHNQP